MGNFYSTDHTSEDHIHKDIICNVEEPPLQQYRLKTVNNRLLGVLKEVLPDPNPRP